LNGINIKEEVLMWSHDEAAIRAEVVYHQERVRASILSERLAAAAACCRLSSAHWLARTGERLRRTLPTWPGIRLRRADVACCVVSS
jgi:hypothetical protein